MSTPAVSTTITGANAARDAPVASRAPGVPGIGIDAIAAVAGEFGLECQSFEQAPEMGATFALDCRRDEAGVLSSIVVSYWAPDYIDDVNSVVVSSGDGVVPPGHAGPLFHRLADRLLGEAAAAKVAQYINDPACEGHCSMTIGGTNMTVTVGERGARQITFSSRSWSGAVVLTHLHMTPW